MKNEIINKAGEIQTVRSVVEQFQPFEGAKQALQLRENQDEINNPEGDSN